ITVASIVAHYLIGPALLMNGNSWFVTAIALIYPIADLTIFFVITIMYYLIQKNGKREALLLVITGFVIQVLADSLYVYAAYSGSYQPGHFTDLLWLLSPLFIGYSEYYARMKQGAKLWLIANPVK